MNHPTYHQQNRTHHIAAPRRSLAPDIARGMMLLFIALANVSYLLWDQPSGQTNAHPIEGTVIDQALQALMMVAVDHRALPMFAFLFGYGIVQFMNSRLDRGIPETTIRRMLRRRHWWLLVFGLVHAGLLFYGDVLGTYALTALVLVWLFFRRQDITLKIWSSIGLSLIGIYAVLSIIGGVFAAAYPQEAPDPEVTFSVADTRDAAVGETNYLTSILARLGAWAVLTPFQIVGLVTPICILLGFLAARRRLLDNPAEHRKTLIRIAAIGIPVGWLGGAPGALAHTGIIDLPVHRDLLRHRLRGHLWAHRPTLGRRPTNTSATARVERGRTTLTDLLLMASPHSGTTDDRLGVGPRRTHRYHHSSGHRAPSMAGRHRHRRVARPHRPTRPRRITATSPHLWSRRPTTAPWTKAVGSVR